MSQPEEDKENFEPNIIDNQRVSLYNEETEMEKESDEDSENKDHVIKHKYKALIRRTGKAYSPWNKNSLIKICMNAFAYHRFDVAAKILTGLVNDNRIPHSFIIKSGLLLNHITSNKNDVFLVNMTKDLLRYNIFKKELILEVIIELIKRGNIKKAKEFVESNGFYLTSRVIRSLTAIDTYLEGYIIYLDYLEWLEYVKERRQSVFFSQQYFSNDIDSLRISTSLQELIKKRKNINLDIFVLILIDVLNYRGNDDEAFEILSVYIKNNCNNLNAHIYMYNFCNQNSQIYHTWEIESLKNISRLCPSHKLVLEFVKKDEELTYLEKIQLLMEFIDYRENNSNEEAWQLLSENIKLIIISNDETQRKKVEDMWIKYYKSYWVKSYFSETNLNNQLVNYKKIIIDFFESNHTYVNE